MFNFGKKKGYKEQIKDALAKSDSSAIERVARAAYQDSSSDEDLLAWVAGVIYEMKVVSALDLLNVFVERYPSSFHLIRVYLADLMTRLERHDETTDHARVYLRLAADHGLLSRLTEQQLAVVREAASRAFLLLTAVYTTLGARSYSKRALEYGLQFALLPSWVDTIKSEMSQLTAELNNPEINVLDGKWERFFSNGDHADELYKLCADRDWMNLAKRIDLMEGQFRLGAGDRVQGDKEILMLVLETEQHEFLLG